VNARDSTYDPGGLPEDEPGGQTDAALPGDAAVRSWGPAPPSTLDAFIERWAEHFATDPAWLNIFQSRPGGDRTEPDPLEHSTFCRRLALALAPAYVESCGPSQIKSWGPAPPSTRAGHATAWYDALLALVTPRDPASSSAQARAPGRVLIVPPSPHAPRLPSTPSTVEMVALPPPSIGGAVGDLPPQASPVEPSAERGCCGATCLPHSTSSMGCASSYPTSPRRRTSPGSSPVSAVRPAPPPAPSLDNAIERIADAVVARLEVGGTLAAPSSSSETWYDQDTAPIARRAYLDACRSGELRSKRIGKSRLVRREELDAWIDAHAEPEQRPPATLLAASPEPSADDLLRSAGIVLRAPAGKAGHEARGSGRASSGRRARTK
jgi:hypothetical protein